MVELLQEVIEDLLVDIAHLVLFLRILTDLGTHDGP